MSEAYDKPVTLKIHLGGAIAFVPDGNTFWALMPHALIPTPARWRAKGRRLSARSSHMPLLIVEEELLLDEKPPRIIYEAAKIRLEDNSFPMTPGAKAAIDLVDDELIFDQSGNGICCHNEVRDFAPQMKEISKIHRFASKTHCHPRSQQFQNARVSAAFHMHSGALSVGSLFGPKGKPPDVNFGYVSWPLNLLPPAWQKKVANHLVWTLTYPPCTTITIRRRPFPRKDPDRAYKLKVPETGVVEIAILHAEPELPFLFRNDPQLPKNFAKFPDPDFEVFYNLSTKTSRWLPWRVPISRSDRAGGEEKTCANGFFEGFK